MVFCSKYNKSQFYFKESGNVLYVSRHPLYTWMQPEPICLRIIKNRFGEANNCEGVNDIKYSKQKLKHTFLKIFS